jgi:aryl-alcohol dehydrogenase-like predicted oxidoreductase
MIEQLRLGTSGLHVSRIALGMMSFGDKSRREWVLDEHEAEPIVRAAIEHGVTFFDTADMYAAGASEVVTGRVLKKLISREQAVVATKLYYQTTEGPNGRGLSRKHVMAAIDASLARLGMDYVDLFQVHRFDTQTPVEETMEALDDVVKSGKARYIGASTMAAWQFMKMQTAAERRAASRFVSMQNHYNLLNREDEREVIPCCADQGVGIIPYSPLARGFLAGTRTRDGAAKTLRAESDPAQDRNYGRDSDFDVIDRVVAIARERDVAPAQVALAWLLHQPAVTAPIVGATRLAHVEDAVAATQLELSPEELDRLIEAYRPYPIEQSAG